MPGFLNSAALFGLFAAAIPLILHLLNRRRRHIVEFSTLRFLKQLEKKEMNRLRLKRLLLLLIRTLIVISIVLSFSRPTIRGYLPGGELSTNAVILLDNSLSMQILNEEMSLFDESTQAVTEILGTFNKNDRLILLSSVQNERDVSADMKWSSPENIDLEDVNISYRSSDLKSALQKSIKLLNNKKSANKELFIISDFQGKSVVNIDNNIDKTTNDLHVYLLKMTSNELNYSISRADVISKVLREGSSVRIGIEVRSNSEENNEVRLELFIEGTRVGQTILNPTSQNAAISNFSVPIKRSGFISGFAELEDDALKADNRRYFNLYIPEQIRVLAIGSENDLFFTAAAIRTSLKNGARSELKVIKPSEINRVHLDDFDVILLSALPEQSDRFAQQLKEYVKIGGGLLLFPGNGFDIEKYNDSFSSELNMPKINGIARSDDLLEEYTTIGTIDWNHPLFAGIFSGDESDLNYPKIKKYYTIEEHTNGEDIAILVNDKPFISEFRLGEGHIIFMLTAPSLDWSDFPLKGLWVPFISRAVEYAMTGQSSFIDTVRVGSDLSFDMDLKKPGNNLMVKTPNGKSYAILAEAKGNKFQARFDKVDLPGIYRLIQDDKLLKMKSVNIDRKELIWESEFNQYLNEFKNGFVKVSSVSEIGQDIRESRVGIELWRFFALVAFILLIAEMVIQNVKIDKEE